MPNGRLIEWLDGQLAKRQKKATTVAVEAGLDRSIVSKWRRGQEAKADDVRNFTKALGAPVVDAFLAAGFMGAEDAHVREVERPLSSVGDEELLAEIRRRMKGAADAVHQTAPTRASSTEHQNKEVKPSLDELEKRPGESMLDIVGTNDPRVDPGEDDQHGHGFVGR